MYHLFLLNCEVIFYPTSLYARHHLSKWLSKHYSKSVGKVCSEVPHFLYIEPHDSYFLHTLEKFSSLLMLPLYPSYMASKCIKSGKKSKQHKPANPSSTTSTLEKHSINIHKYPDIKQSFSYYS